MFLATCLICGRTKDAVSLQRDIITGSRWRLDTGFRTWFMRGVSLTSAQSSVWHEVFLYLHSLGSVSFQYLLFLFYLCISGNHSVSPALSNILYLFDWSCTFNFLTTSGLKEYQDLFLTFFPLGKKPVVFSSTEKTICFNLVKEVRARMNYRLYLLSLDSLFLSIPGLTLLGDLSRVKLFSLASSSSNRGS